MGKRKAAKPPPKKAAQKVPKVFSCPFCNHEGSVECKLNFVNQVGELICRICQEKFRMTIDRLTEPIDVYSEWIDECERVNTACE